MWFILLMVKLEHDFFLLDSVGITNLVATQGLKVEVNNKDWTLKSR